MNRRFVFLVLAPAVLLPAPPTLAVPSPSDPQPTEACKLLGAPIASVDFVDFYATEGAANRVAASIDRDIFRVQARKAATGDGWVVLAEFRELPTSEAIERHRPGVKALGERHGGHGLLLGCRSVPFRR